MLKLCVPMLNVCEVYFKVAVQGILQTGCCNLMMLFESDEIGADSQVSLIQLELFPFSFFGLMLPGAHESVVKLA